MTARIGRRRFLQGSAAGALALAIPQARIADAFADAVCAPVGPEHKRETLRALIDTVIPGPPLDDSPGGLQAGIDEPFIEVIDRLQPGVPLGDLLVTALDAHATLVEPGQTFACLDHDGRDRALRGMDQSQAEEERLLALLAVSIPYTLFYSEVGGDTSWPLVGFPGHSVEGWAPSQFGCPKEGA